MSKSTKKKFYKTNWFMWLMLVFFAPVGIALLWLRKDVSFNKKTKGALSAIFTVLFILAATKGSETPTDDKLASTQIEQPSKATNIEEKLSEKQTDNDEPKTKSEDVSTSNEEIKSPEEIDKEITNKVTDELFAGYKLIEVDGGDLSGNRESNVVVDIGFGEREYYAFTNEYGQLIKVVAKEIVLQSTSEPLKSNGRYYSDEAKVPGTESSDYDEGHVIADSLGGVSNAYNITPQNSTLNRHGDQAYMEKVIRDAGGCTDFVAIITYSDTKTQTPSHYSFTYTLNGNVINDEFDNIDPEKANNTGTENTNSEASASSTENTNSEASAPSTPSTPSTSEIVYWTPNGKSYHSTKSCSTLSRSKTILEGTLQESGKNDPCDRCH